MMSRAMSDRRYTSRMRLLLPALILGIMMIAAFVFSSNAYATDENGFYDGGTAYKYRVTVYSGIEGTFKGQKVWSAEYDAGSSVTIDTSDCEVTNDKYYVRGFRITGHDNDETSGYANISITNLDSDVAYEVAYGIKGNMVAYTVRYVDKEDKKLRENDTYYGMPGDKPVVAYRYIEGYVPDVYSQAKTLSENEADNVFTFTYSEGETVTTTTTTTVTQTVPGANPPGTPGNPAGTRVAAAAVPGTGAPGGNDGATIGDGDTPLAGPDQFADLDDDGTPMAGPDGEGKNFLPMAIGTGIGILLLIALILYLLRRRRAESEETES